MHPGLSNKEPLEVLLVEDNPDDAFLISELIREADAQSFSLTCVARLGQAVALLERNHFDAVVLDLGLPDRQGFETFSALSRRAPRVPVVVLSGSDDEAVALRSMRGGAQDYLVKDRVDGPSLTRAILYAIERKRIELELQRARDEALRYSRMKSAFLASVTHELRTPLHGILGFGRLLLDSEPTEQERHEFAGMIVSSGEALLRLVNDILDLSKVEAGRLELDEQAVDLGRLLEECVRLVEVSARERQIEMNLRIDADLPELLVLDPGRFRQVLLNLLGNAVKFTEQGHVTVTVRVEEDVVRVAVRDTGIGIPLEEQQRIFEPFVQVPGSCGAVGTGLGLAIARQLVERMGGRIGLESWPGQGSTFWFSLPLRPARAPAQPAEPLADAPRTWPGARILVADDDRIGRRLLEHLLTSAGHQVVTVADGQAALETAAQEYFDLIFLDSRMPRLSGPEVARQLRLREGHPVPLVGLTADARKEERERCLAAGMDDFLAKPVDFEALSEVLNRLLPGPDDEVVDWEHLEQLRRRLLRGGNLQPFKDTVESFLKCAPQRLEALTAALEEGNGDEATRLAHQLRGACACLGARRLANLSHDIELRRTDPREACGHLAQELEVFRRALEERGWISRRPSNIIPLAHEATRLRWTRSELLHGS